MCADQDWHQIVEDELMAMTGLEIPAYLRSKFDLEDIRQRARLKVRQNPRALEGRSTAEQRAYVKKAIASELTDAIRHFKASRRHTARERPLDAEQNSSFGRLSDLLATDHTSPSGRASRSEEFARLEAALNSLPETQSQAVRLHHLQGMSVQETATAMKTTKPAVAGLLARGMNRLRELLQDR
jgi:RNA polymerase sigma-70 factor (ECF subfamily)